MNNSGSIFICQRHFLLTGQSPRQLNWCGDFGTRCSGLISDGAVGGSGGHGGPHCRPHRVCPKASAWACPHRGGPEPGGGGTKPRGCGRKRHSAPARTASGPAETATGSFGLGRTGCFPSLRRRGPPTDTGRCAGATESLSKSCKQRSPPVTTSASGSLLDSRSHDPDQPAVRWVRPRLRECLHPGSLTRASQPGNASSPLRWGPRALEPESSSRPLGDQGRRWSASGAPAAQFMRPPRSTDFGRPAGIAAIWGEDMREVTPHLLAFRTLLHPAPGLGETKLPRALPQRVRRGWGRLWLGRGSPFLTEEPELLSVTSDFASGVAIKPP